MGDSNGSEDEAETGDKLSQENLSLTSTPTLGIKLHTHTHSDPVQKNIYRQCTKGYIHIYIFYLDYLQESKAALFENIKIPTFLFFVKH